MSAAAFPITAGQKVQIIDTEGGQPGDFVAFNEQDLSEHFSQGRTRVENRRYRITTGHKLWTNRIPPRVMFEIIEDTAGNHDLLYTPCCRSILLARFKVSRDGCQELLAEALSQWNIPICGIPEPLNLFFSVNTDTDGNISIGRHQSQPGDFIRLKSEMDCVIAISTCPVPQKDRTNSGFTVVISD